MVGKGKAVTHRAKCDKKEKRHYEDKTDKRHEASVRKGSGRLPAGTAPPRYLIKMLFSYFSPVLY